MRSYYEDNDNGEIEGSIMKTQECKRDIEAEIAKAQKVLLKRRDALSVLEGLLGNHGNCLQNVSIKKLLGTVYVGVVEGSKAVTGLIQEQEQEASK